MATDKKPRIVWKEEEWFDVMALVVPMRDAEHMGAVPATFRAQKQALPKDRQRTEIGIKASRQSGHLRDYEMRVRAGWVPDARKGDAPVPAAPKLTRARKGEPTQEERDAALEATFTGRLVHWTDREWAMMSLAVRHRIDAGDVRPLGRVFFETQTSVLPLDRCRPVANFRRPAELQPRFDEAIRLAWTLPPELQAKLTGRGEEYAEHQAKTAAGLAATQTPIDPAPTLPDAPSGPSSPVAAPLPPMLAPSGDPLAAKIAGILADAGSRIAQETRAFVLAELEHQLDAIVAGIASGLRSHVQQVLSAELGGPVKSPTPAPVAPESGTPPKPADDAPPTVESAPKKRVRVDVVGMNGAGLAQVRAAAMRLGIDAYFIDSDRGKSSTWEPRENVILATKFINHGTTERAKKKGANIMFANAGPQSVIGVLESLAEHRGTLQ